MVDAEKLSYANQLVYFCPNKCIDSKHRSPGLFGKSFKGLVFVERDPGYLPEGVGPKNKRLVDYSSIELTPTEAEVVLRLHYLKFIARQKFYDAVFYTTGLNWDDIAVTFVVHCPTKDFAFKDTSIKHHNKKFAKVDEGPSIGELAAVKCLPLLKKQIDALHPDAIVALGREAVKALKPDAEIGEVHEIFFKGAESSYPVKLICMNSVFRIRDYRKAAEWLMKQLNLPNR
jgi:hypothetical protein